VIDLAILGLLKEQELHGYEVKKRLAELPVGRFSVSFGSLYPALNRLEKLGSVKAVEANRAGGAPVPSSGSLTGELAAFRARRRVMTSGRSRKVYGLTPAGDAHLLELLAGTAPVDDRTFALKVAFCRHLDRPARLALFERRRGELADRLDERRRLRRPDSRLDQYVHSLRERDDQSLTSDLAWLDRLIAGEKHQPMEESTP
jgi:DNA-binding PadR family transcriptional regulator